MKKLRSFYAGNLYFAFSLLWLYLWAIFMLQTAATGCQMTLPFVLTSGVLSLFASYCLLYLFGRIFQLLIPAGSSLGKTRRGLISLGAFLVTLALYSIFFFCQYPGGMSSDNYAQLIQAYTGEYNNWHPVLHTLLFYTFPVKLGGGYPAIVYLQIFYWSLAIGYLVKVLLQNEFPKVWVAFFCIYIWVNPYLAKYLMYPWKDLAMTVFALFLVGQYMQILFSKGSWLKKPLNTIVFGFVAVCCSYMRHNAILFTAPLLLILLFYILKTPKLRLQILSTIVAFVLLVQGSYSILSVQKPDNRVVETVGMPATIWCGAVSLSPERLPDSLLEVMYEIATPEVYARHVVGDFNNTKWYGADTSRIDRMSYLEVLDYTLQCFYYAPQASFQAFAKLTDLVWGLSPALRPGLAEMVNNPFNIEQREYPVIIQQFCSFYSSIDVLCSFFGAYGLHMLIIILMGLGLYAKKRLGFLHALPLLCYNYGTMLLLSGNDYRFFLPSLPLWIIVLFLMLKDPSTFREKTSPGANIQPQGRPDGTQSP